LIAQQSFHAQKQSQRTNDLVHGLKLDNGFMRSVLSVVLVTRLCEPANPPLQCQIRETQMLRFEAVWFFRRLDEALFGDWQRNGGANRDRTDDLKLAKLALSQLSYGPVVVEIVVGSGGPGKTWTSDLTLIKRAL
jgi:hypothetical protein